MCIENEIWKSVVGYECCYEISSHGRLKTISRKVKCRGGFRLIKEKIMKPGFWGGKDWYVTYCLSKNSSKKSFVGHSLVALAFIPNPENRPEINHKNGIKHDNRADNLEWVTSSENKYHSHRTGLQIIPKGERHHLYGKTGATANSSKIVLDTNTGVFYESLKEAASIKNIGRTWLSRKLNRVVNNNTGLIYV
jgi:hypothetical protein